MCTILVISFSLGGSICPSVCTSIAFTSQNRTYTASRPDTKKRMAYLSFAFVNTFTVKVFKLCEFLDA